MPVYFHFSNWRLEEVRIDAAYETPRSRSYYWTNKLEFDPAGLSRIDTLQVPAVISYFRNADGKINFDSVQFNADIQRFIKGFMDSIGTHRLLEVRKEAIFEEVRSAEYSNKPSRRRCMFLIDPSVDPREVFQRQGFSQYEANYTLLKIETISGNIHIANSRLLNCNMLKVDEIEENARLYWSDRCELDADAEILFEGRYRVLESLS
jgi:hypothetical protein